jgi:hypothetical protein
MHDLVISLAASSVRLLLNSTRKSRRRACTCRIDHSDRSSSNSNTPFCFLYGPMHEENGEHLCYFQQSRLLRMKFQHLWRKPRRRSRKALQCWSYKVGLANQRHLGGWFVTIKSFLFSLSFLFALDEISSVRHIYSVPSPNQWKASICLIFQKKKQSRLLSCQRKKLCPPTCLKQFDIS